MAIVDGDLQTVSNQFERFLVGLKFLFVWISSYQFIMHRSCVQS